MSTLTDRITETVEKHAYDFGECECSEYTLSVPYPRHLAEVVAAVVAEWLASEEAQGIMSAAILGRTATVGTARALAALAAEAVKGAGQ